MSIVIGGRFDQRLKVQVTNGKGYVISLFAKASDVSSY